MGDSARSGAASPPFGPCSPQEPPRAQARCSVRVRAPRSDAAHAAVVNPTGTAFPVGRWASVFLEPTVKIHSFFRTESFVFVLRGRRLILGEIADLLDGDLRVSGSKRHGCLRVSMVENGRFRPMGGRWSRARYPMPTEMCERVLDAVRTLGADEFFIVLCAMLLLESRSEAVEGGVPVRAGVHRSPSWEPRASVAGAWMRVTRPREPSGSAPAVPASPRERQAHRGSARRAVRRASWEPQAVAA